MYLYLPFLFLSIYLVLSACLILNILLSVLSVLLFTHPVFVEKEEEEERRGVLSVLRFTHPVFVEKEEEEERRGVTGLERDREKEKRRGVG